MRGTVFNRIPRITLPVAGQDWPTIVDTGFNGDLELPLNLFDELSSEYNCRQVSLLAGGQTVEEDSYLVQFPFDGQIVEAEATFVESSEILLGTGLLTNYRLEIDYVKATVELLRIA